MDGASEGGGGEAVAEDEAGGRADERDLPAGGALQCVRGRGVHRRAGRSRAVPARLEPHHSVLAPGPRNRGGRREETYQHSTCSQGHRP